MLVIDIRWSRSYSANYLQPTKTLKLFWIESLYVLSMPNKAIFLKFETMHWVGTVTLGGALYLSGWHQLQPWYLVRWSVESILIDQCYMSISLLTVEDQVNLHVSPPFKRKTFIDQVISVVGGSCLWFNCFTQKCLYVRVDDAFMKWWILCVCVFVLKNAQQYDYNIFAFFLNSENKICIKSK